MHTPKSILGIDAGTASVKVVQLRHTGMEWTLARAVCVDVEPREGEDRRETVLTALRKALEGIDLKDARVHCVVNSPQTCVRNMMIPSMPRQELAEAVKWEVKNYISFSLEDAVLDFETAGEVLDKGVKKINVAAAVSPRDTILPLMALFSAVGIKVAAVIPAAVALQRLMARGLKDSQGTTAVLELGASVSELSIFKEGVLQFSRKLPVTGQELTESLMETLATERGQVALSREEAERIKRQYGIPNADEEELIEDKISAHQVLSLIRPKVEQLVSEIDRSFDYYREESHSGKVDRILLYGGGARLKGLAEFIGNELGLEVHLGNALEVSLPATGDVKKGAADWAHQWNLALGAALASPAGGINLLPPEIRERTRRLMERISLKAAAAAVVTSVLLLYAGGMIHSAVLRKKLEALGMEYSRLAPLMEGFREKILIGRIIADKPLWEEVLKEISHGIPSYMYLTQIAMEEDVIFLKGVVVKTGQSGQSDEVLLSDFMRTLEKGIFKNVNLVRTKKKAEGLVTSEFEIKCGVD